MFQNSNPSLATVILSVAKDLRVLLQAAGEILLSSDSLRMTSSDPFRDFRAFVAIYPTPLLPVAPLTE